MACNFIWNNLPKQIKDKIGEDVLWFDLPNKLDEILEDLKLEKPDCYADIYPDGHTIFIWFDLTSQLTNLCELEDCIE